MLQRKIPSTGELLPVIGMGTWIKFDLAPGTPSVRSLSALVNEFSSSGGKLIDTSPMYGRAEDRIGETLNGRSDLFYATKVWTTGRDQGIRQMNDSMRKMKLEKIDLIQIHNLVDWRTHLKTLREWKENGKTRYTGITHYQSAEHDTLAGILKTEPVDFVQFNYSINHTHAEETLLRIAEETGTAVIINEPLDKGRLFSIVKNKPVPGWAAENEINNWTEFFLKYILAEPAVNCVIPATSNTDHLKQILNSGKAPLPDQRMRIKMRQYLQSSIA